MMEIFICWNWLLLFSAILIILRKDSWLVLKDLASFIVRPFPLVILSLLLTYLLLPFTIPFSLKNIFSKDEQNK